MHPPIPPSCDLFYERTEGDFKGEWLFRLDGDVWLSKAEGRQRAIIASVARCAWLDKADAIMHKCLLENRVHDRYGIDDEPEAKEYEECFNNASLWREWNEPDFFKKRAQEFTDKIRRQQLEAKQ